MNRDRRIPERRRPYRLQTPTRGERERASKRMPERDDIAPWVIADVRAWPRSVEDRLVAVRVGVRLEHVQLARTARP